MGVSATYHGPYTRGYLQYVDLATYHTLVAVPGNTYDIGIASGWEALAAIPADGFWGAVTPPGAPFSGVPGAAVPGSFILSLPSLASAVGGALEEDAREADPDVEWAQQVISSAGNDAVFRENRERLDRAAQMIAVLRRKQQKS